MNYKILFPFVISSLYTIELKYIENRGVLTISCCLFSCNVKNIIKVSSLDGFVC